MALTAEQPGLAEQYAVAVNTSDLDHRALDIVGAMGYARLELATAAKDDAAAIAGEIGALIWRARDGKDKTAEGLLVHEFASWLRATLPWAAEVDRADPGVVERFSSRVIEESFRLKCMACGGGGRMQVLPSGKRVKPSGTGRGYAKLANCALCKGTGRRRVSPPERKRVLGGVDRKAGTLARRIDPDEYDRLWARHFGRAFSWLRDLATGPRENLHSAIKGFTVRP